MIIFITGSESTGKTKLASSLSELFGVPWVPEYARGYIESHDYQYGIGDIENIAKRQIEQLKHFQSAPLVFFDTGLIITKVWFMEVCHNVPDWFSLMFSQYTKGKYLLCYPDLPWMPDPVRENGDKRLELHAQYEKEIIKLAAPYAIIKGYEQDRLEMAVRTLNSWGIYYK